MEKQDKMNEGSNNLELTESFVDRQLTISTSTETFLDLLASHLSKSIIIIKDLKLPPTSLLVLLSVLEDISNIRICREFVLKEPRVSVILSIILLESLTGKASHAFGSVPWSLKVPQPVRAYSVNKNDRLLSIMIVIWSDTRQKKKSDLTDSNLYQGQITHSQESFEAHLPDSASQTHSPH